MNRETKIGLLVGLSFIIVVGVLLSDHIASAAKPVNPGITNAGQNARSSYAVAAPPGPVLTLNGASQAEQTSGAETEQAGNTAAGQGANNGEATNTGQIETHAQNNTNGNGGTIQFGPASNNPQQRGQLVGVSHDPGAEVISHGRRLQQQRAQTQHNQQQARPAFIEHVAQHGDSLSRITAKYFDRDTPGNRQKIIAVNPSLQRDPNLISLGRTYKIPTQVQTQTNQNTNTQGGNTQGTNAQAGNGQGSIQSAPPQVTMQSSPGTRWYTVQRGDSIWRIAKHEVGSIRAMNKIRQLNSNIRNDVLRPGMRIRLPERQ